MKTLISSVLVVVLMLAGCESRCYCYKECQTEGVDTTTPFKYGYELPLYNRTFQIMEADVQQAIEQDHTNVVLFMREHERILHECMILLAVTPLDWMESPDDAPYDEDYCEPARREVLRPCVIPCLKESLEYNKQGERPSDAEDITILFCRADDSDDENASRIVECIRISASISFEEKTVWIAGRNYPDFFEFMVKSFDLK